MCLKKKNAIVHGNCDNIRDRRAHTVIVQFNANTLCVQVLQQRAQCAHLKQDSRYVRAPTPTMFFDSMFT
jgi:hypothetical protein